MSNATNKFIDNSITTTKYTFYNFLFKNLYEQFHRFANCYFLFMAVLQTIPTLSPTGQFTAFFPLAFVLICTMIKDAYEDIKRLYSDRVTNNRIAHVLRGDKFEDIFWKDVKTGDIVKVDNKEPFPCDLILVSSSESQGLCYVETSSLDGETNLKIKRCRHETLELSTPEALDKTRMIVECEKPNNRLYKFEGTMVLSNGKKLSIDTEQICLRGSSLKNTDFMIGVAIFTGHDTKLMMNTKETPHKISKIERMINKLILLVLVVQIILVLSCDIALMVWTNFNAGAWYLFRDVVIDSEYIAWNGFKGYWTILILLTNLIPISLYVSIEAAKLVQGIMISQDLAMYHEATDTPALVRSSALNEDLGQINYIFSDKTGTLTENKMDYDRPEHVKNNPNFQFFDERMNDGAWMNEENAQDIQNFITLLAVCHTVIPERSHNKPNEIIYQASSPDEAALVKAAKYLGIEFINRTTNTVTIKIMENEAIEYQVLDIIEFSSDRKRQSVIVRDPEGKLLIMTKGADSMIYPLLNEESVEKYGPITLEHLDQFGNEGLRTLLCAQAYLDEEEYQQWHREYEEAKTSLENRQVKVEMVGSKIEKNLQFVGATAIEDKLQQGVGDTIYELRRAGINIWVLTGDKLETAINIGFACDLLNSGMTLLIVEGNTIEELKTFLEKSLSTCEGISSSDALGLVVEGDKLLTILEGEHNNPLNPANTGNTLRNLFLNLSVKCKSVICCRVSPKQKSDVVLLIKNNVDSITLAIGDGSNDVSMIQSAHVGIGISGQEGLQAVNASDYAIGQFRFLKRLLLVHGRWSYRRVSKLVLYCFYKNSLLYLTQLWYIFSNGYSGATVHDKWTIALYNLIFSGLPIIVLAVMDRDVSADVAEKFPELYYQGQKNRFFNAKVFISWVVNSLFHSLVCFFVPYYCLVDSKFLDGHDIDPETIGIVIYSCVLVVISLKLCIETSSWTWVNVLIYTGSLLSWPAFIFVYGSIYYIFGYPYPVISEFYGITERWRIFLTPQFYMIVLLVTFMCCIRDIFWKGFVRMRSRNAYYQIQGRKKSKKSRQEILENFPFEEGLPVKMKKKKKFNVVELQEIKKVFETAVTSVAKFNYRGFAFSQTEQQGDFLKQYYNGTSSTNNNNNGNNNNTNNTNNTNTTTTSNTGMNTLPNSANDNVIINISNDDIIKSKEE
ncbi:predicted protein [Naegleria gruberi]|uniref:Phospholipid-transporting ATPase n=1 Tax=Naegleria gruberi TaxID=5762 RepID=D2VUS3_NAEGR|nr:uncharacterized protein NAEGRDRAFT_44754 [Naegleria gruberi]EFC39377.1 predicted protein [Naegleria gruberi]|eukprot:XP_002672121.1 predicted protein [Naegleria gruberi strain NEG-M]